MVTYRFMGILTSSPRLNTHFDKTNRNYNICLYDASDAVKETTNYINTEWHIFFFIAL